MIGAEGGQLGETWQGLFLGFLLVSLQPLVFRDKDVPTLGVWQGHLSGEVPTCLGAEEDGEA